MIPVHQCEDISDTVPLFPVKGLFFKPISRIHVSVHYPQLKQTLPKGGKTVSSWEIMEKLKALLSPDKFISIRVVKNTLEFIRFEGDLENRNVMKAIMARLEGKTMKITGFKEPMKIRVAEAKIPFPTKYDWDTFFRDAKNMNEMKPGERPDTIHLQNLPCKWFSDRPLDEKPIPSEKLFRRIWENYGDVRAVDIPLADPYRTQMQSSIAGIKTFTFSSDAVFEAYVQYKDYMSFVRAMDALRGCYILHQENNKYAVANVKVDFDKSKHLGEENIRRRRNERERLIEKEKQEKMNAALSKLEENEKTRREIEDKKKETDKNQAKLDYKIALEERKYVIARRKLEAIRLMDYLFERLKKKLKDSKKLKHKDKDSEIHEKIMGKYKQLQQAKVDEQHKKLKKFHKSKKRTSSHHSNASGDESYYEGGRSRSRSRSISREHSRSGSRHSNRSRDRSKSREVDGRERSRSQRGSRSRSRSRSRGGGRDGSRSRSRSRSGSRSRRSRSRSPRDDYKRDSRYPPHYGGRGGRGRGFHNNNRGGDTYYNSRGGNHRNYEDDHHRDTNYKDYDNRDGRRGDYPPPQEDDRYHGSRNDYDNRDRDYPHSSRPPRGHFHRGRGDGLPPPFRGRGRGGFPSRYIGDWEFRDHDHHGPPQYGPRGGHHESDHPPPHPSSSSHYHPPPEYYRGRGRGDFRGRGRGRGGFHHNNSHPHPYQHNKYQRFDNNNGPVVNRDFTYLEELDRAYEKYFKSITAKNERSGDDDDRSPDH